MVELIEENDTYSKIKFENIKTGDIEYLEKYDNDGVINYVSHSKEGKIIINIDDDSFTYKNIDTNEVNIIHNTKIDSLDNKQNNFITSNDGWTEWEYQKTSYYSNQVPLSLLTLVVSLVATRLKLDERDTYAISVATFIFTNAIPAIYTTTEKHLRFSVITTSNFQEKYISTIFKYSTWSYEIGSSTVIYTYY